MMPTGLQTSANLPPPNSSTSNGRSRLRGFSYLRFHTHHHSHSPAAPTVVTAANASTACPTQAASSTIPSAPAAASGPVRRASPDSNRSPPTTAQASDTPNNVWVSSQSGFDSPANQISTELSQSSAIVSSGQPMNSAAAAMTSASHTTALVVGRPRTEPTQVRSIDEAIGDCPLVPASSLPPASTGPSIRGPSATQRPALTACESQPSIRFTPHIDPRSGREALSFAPIERVLKRGDEVIRVGRYSERDQNGTNTYNLNNSAAPAGFKSKVVSRRHCEFWCDNGQWYVKDVKSSSGTFLNHIRLSSPGVESRAYPIHDGDILQLGIDFKGGEEPMFRCVKVRVELNRAWQKGLNNFNMSAHKRLRSMAGKSSGKEETGSLHTSECSICLMAVAPCQALFVAPCSHVWHFKCIRPLIDKGYPAFLCPNCRAIADLGKEIDEDDINQIMKDYDADNLYQDMPDDENEGGQDGDGESRVETGTALGDANTEVAPRNDSDSGVGEPMTNEEAASAHGYITPTRDRTHEAQDSLNTRGNRIDDSDEHDGFMRQNTSGPMTPLNDAGPFVLDGAGFSAATASLSRRDA